ncbi:Histone-lysine N-methyltransferase pr-set7 [Orchesella cincta]|uniref:[histone H4]-lysine(20) N-methyltransferase n=1 Tax=Orchesella cincta TaxID=48709 RepID=A0A1D2NG00_ORCCI|nr:Histone-lysine N-methyltransferase pr-set7 [Orchesella cincta]
MPRSQRLVSRQMKCYAESPEEESDPPNGNFDEDDESIDEDEESDRLVEVPHLNGVLLEDDMGVEAKEKSGQGPSRSIGEDEPIISTRSTKSGKCWLGAASSNGVVNCTTKTTTKRRGRRACTTPPPPPSPPQSSSLFEEDEEEPTAHDSECSSVEKLIKSPPTPHKIQSLDEKSLRLDENYLAISPSTKNGYAHNNHHTANNAKPLNSTHQNKTVKYVDGENGNKEKPSVELFPVRRRLKLTDYFVQRRSNRKTQEAINAEKHQLLVKAIAEGRQDGLMAKRFNGKGRGVVATKRFLRHEFVVEYAGELLTSVEARARENKYSKDTGAGCYMYYFQYNNQQYCVDATKESDRLGRLINHSRNGNLVTKVVEVKGVPRLILIAKRDIDMDDELTYDYGDRSREALRHHPWLAY